jgi:hypothetical protein
VHEDNLHIIPDPQKGFPAPEIPADEAWNKMALLLAAEVPPTEANDQTSSKLSGKQQAIRHIAGNSHIWGIALIGVGLAGALLWGSILLKKSYDTPVKDKEAIFSENKMVISDTISSGNDKIIEDKEIAEALKTDGMQVPKTYAPVVLEQKELTELPKSTYGKNSISSSVSTAEIETKNSREEAVSVPASEARFSNSESKIPITTVGDEVQERNRASAKDTIVKAFTVSPDTLQNPKSTDGIESQNANSTFSNVSNNSKGKPDSGNIPENPSKSPRNLEWHGTVYGNFGQVYQKERNANTFYGCFITGGLWNPKLNAGIETGMGIGNYKDYGTIENTFLKMDSIITRDTIWHQVDSIWIPEIFDTAIYFPLTSHDTLTYNYNYTYLQIPFFITKQIADFGKFSFGIKVGPQVGFLISTNESVTHSNISASGDLTGVVNKNYTRLDVSWQLLFAPQIRWDISDRLALGISPSVVLFLNNLYDKKNRPSSTPYGLSIYGGITYKFK